MQSEKGSKKWVQKLINQKSRILNSGIKKELDLPEDEQICWLSPLKGDGYREYCDQDFIDKLGIRLERFPLESFWPRGGPQWDALGKSQHGNLFLVEAKSHIDELISTMRAKGSSARKILESLEATKSYLNSSAEVDWTLRFYQYTNRLAHLYLLRHLNKLSAYLVFIYFINDSEMKGPKTIDEWKGAIQLLHSYLGARKHKLQKFIVDVFIDVRSLK